MFLLVEIEFFSCADSLAMRLVGCGYVGGIQGMWAQMLGLGDFYYELGVQVVEVCLATREENGGLIGLSELHQAVVVRAPHGCRRCGGANAYNRGGHARAFGGLSVKLANRAH